MTLFGWVAFLCFWAALVGSAFLGLHDGIAMVLAIPMIIWYGVDRFRARR
jgi:hypothetical protein